MSSKIQLALQVPFAEKDAAKSLGARWEATQKVWYVPHGQDINLFEKWWPSSLKASASTKGPASKPKAAKSSAAGARQAPGGAVITGPDSVPEDTSDTLPWEA